MCVGKCFNRYQCRDKGPAACSTRLRLTGTIDVDVDEFGGDGVGYRRRR